MASGSLKYFPKERWVIRESYTGLPESSKQKCDIDLLKKGEKERCVVEGGMESSE